ncbi:MAG: Type I antifreeze protein [Burkholderiaceae bacterium]|jgi:putative FmdB family regulatory protein|nr:MAG: Type I antifreeze protein [Burkholderiaceae bacterium]
MPIYAYRCESCGYSRDVLQKLADAPLTICPHCGAPAFKKQVTAAGFRLKGSGWYVTDFRNEGNGKANDAAHGKANGAGAANGSADAAATSPASGPAAADNGGTAAGGKADAGTETRAPAAPSADAGGTGSKS